MCASAAIERGNTQLVDVDGEFLTGLDRGPHWGLFIANGEWGQSDGETDISQWFLHTRYNYEFLPWLWGELFYQLQFNEFSRLNLRQLVGVGPRLRFLDVEEPIRLAGYVGAAYMIEYERLAPDTVNEDLETTAHRANTYLSLTLQFSEEISLSNVFYYQPRLSEPKDYRLLNEVQFRCEVNEIISFVKRDHQLCQ